MSWLVGDIHSICPWANTPILVFTLNETVQLHGKWFILNSVGPICGRHGKITYSL